MGFTVTGSITDAIGKQVDNFYVRIGHYNITKPLGVIGVTMEHYVNKASASKAQPTYTEDLSTDADGLLTPQFTYNGESHNWAFPFQYHLTQSVQVEQLVYSSSFTDQEIEYIDFDDDGNEVIRTRTESIETVHTSSELVDRSLIDINQITGSVYEYAYNEVKGHYKATFGDSNVNDDI